MTCRGTTGGGGGTIGKEFNKIKSTENLRKVEEERTMIPLGQLLEGPKEAKV